MDKYTKKYKKQLNYKALQYIYIASGIANPMKQIILDLGDYSRTGRLEASIEKLSVSKTTADCQLLRGEVIHEKSVEIKVSKLPKNQFNKASPKYTIYRLIDNAIKYIKEGQLPIISISTEELYESWKISIEDNGKEIVPPPHNFTI